MESNKRPDATILIVSWNTRELLQICLEGLYRQTGVQLEIIVIDNNSQDGSAEMVRSTFPRTFCITNTINKGFAAANNQGLRIAKGEFVMLVNPDIEFRDPDTIVKIISIHRKNKAGIVGPQLLNSDGSVQQSVRRDPTVISQALIISKIHYLFPHTRALEKYYCSSFAYNTTQQVEQISGAFFSIAQSVIQKIGLLDEGFWIWFEEVDYCYRAKQSSFTIWYTSSTSVIHRGGQSFQKILPKARHRNYSQSLLRYAKKYFTPSQVFILRCAIVLGRILSLFTPSNIRLGSYKKNDNGK